MNTQTTLLEIFLHGDKFSARPRPAEGIAPLTHLWVSNVDRSVPGRISMRLAHGEEDKTHTFDVESPVAITEDGFFTAHDVHGEGFDFRAYQSVGLNLSRKIDHKEAVKAVAKSWVSRREHMLEMGEKVYKVGTKGHADRQMEFWVGASAAAEAYGFNLSGAAFLVATGCDSAEMAKD